MGREINNTRRRGGGKKDKGEEKGGGQKQNYKPEGETYYLLLLPDSSVGMVEERLVGERLHLRTRKKLPIPRPQRMAVREGKTKGFARVKGKKEAKGKNETLTGGSTSLLSHH